MTLLLLHILRPSQFLAYSILEGWSIEDRLDEIRTPTLVVNGKYDIAQDDVTRAYAENILGARWIRFEESSHTPHFEERKRYMHEVGAFLAE